MALQSNTLANPRNSFYATATESGKLWYTFPSQNGQVLLNDASGTQVLRAIGGDLFFNNELLAKAGDIEDIADWALYPALADVNMDGQNLLDVSSAVINNGLTAGNTTLESLTVTNGITSNANITTASLQMAGEPIPALGQITSKSIAASGAVTAGSFGTTGTIGGGAISGTSLTTTGGVDMTNTAITRASAVNISNAGFAPYGALTSPDGVALTWNGATITTGAGGSAAQWANFPAIAAIQGNGQSLSNLSTLATNSTITSGGNIIAPNVVTNGLRQTYDPSGNPALTVEAQNPSGLLINSLRGGIASVATAGNIESTSSAGDITTTAYNSISMDSGNDISLTADPGLNPLYTAAVNLTAKNGNGGQVNIVADPGSVAAFGGVVNITANGGTINIPQPPPDPPLSVTVGGEVNIFANSGAGGLYTLTSAVNIAAAGVNSYAGAIPPISSLAGYNFIFGNAGVNICSGLPSAGFQLPFTTYIYGTGVPLSYGGVRLQSPNGIQMLSDTYMTNLYPLDTDGLTIAGRAFLGTGNVYIEDVQNFTMNGGAALETDNISSVSGSGILYTDNLIASTTTKGIYTNFLKPSSPISTGNPNLVISSSSFGGINNYVEIQNANSIAFDATGPGALSGVQSINGAAWPPPTGDASLWSQYPATSVIDASGFDISGVTTINGSVYPPVVGDVADWATFPAKQNVDISGFDLNNVNSLTMPANGLIVAAGQLSIFSDLSGDLSLAANGGGNVNIGTGNAGDINIQTVGAGNNLNLAGDTATVTAAVKILLDTPTLDANGADIANVSNITNEGTNLLTVQSTVNLIVSAETALTLVSDTADVTVQGQTGVSIYAATGDVRLTADSGEVVIQDSLVNMNNHKIVNLIPGTTGLDAVNYNQLTFRDNTEFYVSNQGSDVSGNGSILAPFLTIQAAITAAELISSAASICNINVASGNYPQSLTFNKGYVVLNGTLQSQTGNEVCEITGSITINCTGTNDVFNRQVAFQGFNITCGAGQSITNTSTSSHTVSFQDCKIFVNSVCYNSTATCADARTYFTNVEITSTNAANVSPVITTNVGLVELERLDLTVDGNAIGILISGTSVLNRCSLSTLDATNTAATLLPLLSFTSTTTSAHSLGNVAFTFTSAVAKTATNAIYINSGVATAIIALNCVFTLAGTASSTNFCIGYNGVGSPTIAGVNNTSLNVNILLPQTTAVQTGITQIAYTDINPPVLASYSSSADQALTGGGSAQALTLNTTNFNSGTVLSGNSIFVASQGNYAINFAVQLQNTSASASASVFVFLKKNGTAAGNNVANSSCFTTVPANTSSVAISPQIILQLNAGDFIQLWISGPGTINTNATSASGTVPASPSVVVNIAQIR
jgi:hypothetical protein